MSFRWTVLASLGLCSLALAHPDDPKAKNRAPTYTGPGYRAARGGGPDLEFPALGVTLLSWITIPEFNQAWASDCWGYVSPSGREYALICLSSGLGFVNISVPEDPTIVDVLPGPTSVWRDVKTYEHYAYAVSEGGQGIQVFDLEQIDSGVVTQVNTVTTGGIPSTHNVALDEDSGFLYRCGGGNEGLRIYDLSDPTTPTFVATWPDRYVHDAQIVTYTEGPYAGREVAFCCSGFNGGGVETGIDILDVTDKSSIEQLARYQYPGGAYSHQGWLSEDRQYMFLNDEQDEFQPGTTSKMYVIDVSDLENPFLATSFENGSTAITHNLYVRGDTVFAANYTSGLRLIDVSDPLSPFEVGFFDTVPENDAANFNSLWSNYPFFPSGTVIGSAVQEGLFVWQVGVITIEYPEGLPDLLDPNGDSIPVEVTAHATELAPGSARLHYDDGGGFLEVGLTPVDDEHLFAAVFPSIECGALVDHYITAETDDGVVWRSPALAPRVTHQAIAAAEGQEVFVDDFETDLGWTVDNTKLLDDGAWERGVPAGTGGRGDPTEDADGSGRCYLTENGPGNTDVDNGATVLISPRLDATGEGVPYLTYVRWYSNDVGINPHEDTMPVEISNDGGETWTLVEDVGESTGAWVKKIWRIPDLLEPTTEMKVRFTASDVGANSIVEAAVDDVRIIFYCGPSTGPDVNGDGVVDVQDLILVITAWGTCPADPEPCPADVDGDGIVGVADLTEVILNWT